MKAIKFEYLYLYNFKDGVLWAWMWWCYFASIFTKTEFTKTFTSFSVQKMIENFFQDFLWSFYHIMDILVKLKQCKRVFFQQNALDHPCMHNRMFQTNHQFSDFSDKWCFAVVLSIFIVKIIMKPHSLWSIELTCRLVLRYSEQWWNHHHVMLMYISNGW